MDPDGDQCEAIAWWNPADLPGNPAVRPELLASIDAVMAALGAPAACGGAGCCAGGCCGGNAGCPCGSQSVAKAVSGDPKAWPGWRLDGPAAAYWAPLITAAVTRSLSQSQLAQIAADYLAANPGQDGSATGKRERAVAAAAWLSGFGIALGLESVAAGIVTDGYLIGVLSAAALAGGRRLDKGGWAPGDADTALRLIEAAGLGAAFDMAVARGAEQAAESLGRAYLGALGRVLAAAEPEMSARDIAAALRAAAEAGAIAEAVAGDVITQAAGEAAQDYYSEQGVEYGQWITDPSSKSGPCALCLANEAAGRVPAGEPYPSGDTGPPAHPHCRCAIGPA